MVNPIRHPNLSSFSPSSDRLIRLMDVRGPDFKTTGRPVSLSRLPLSATVGPHQEIGWRKFGYLPQTYPALTTAIPHGSSTCSWNSEVSPPTTPQKRSTLVQWPEPIRAFPSHSVMLPNSSLWFLTTLQIAHTQNTSGLQRIKVLLSRNQDNNKKEKTPSPAFPPSK
jgi:hypothetical protein